MKGSFLKLINSSYENPTASIILNDEILDTFLLKSGKTQGCLFSFQYCAGDSSKAIKFIPVVKNKVKLSGFTDDTVFYVEHSMKSTKSFTEK